MAKIEMTPAWWKANKAKTLQDKGDTVLKALQTWSRLVKDWDGAKKRTEEDANTLAAALLKLAEVCGDLQKKASTTLHRDTIGYLQNYITKCINGRENLKARKKPINDIRTDKVTFIVKDVKIKDCFIDFAKKRYLYESLHTWILFEQKKYAEATRLYSDNGVGEGHWNIPPRYNLVMYNNFVANIREDQAVVLDAIQGARSAIHEMLILDDRHYTDFTEESLPFLKLMDTRFPIPVE